MADHVHNATCGCSDSGISVGGVSFDVPPSPIIEDRRTPSDLSDLLAKNRKWVDAKKAEDPDFFARQAASHKPEYLFVGCSDARLSVQEMLGCVDGQVFVHRNVGNQVVNSDMNFLTVLTYAIDYLKVKKIIICGHYDCGAVKASMKNMDHGVIEQWIMGVRDVARIHLEELKTIKDPVQLHRRIVELNVQEQAIKLYASPVVQRSQALTGFPTIHPLVYDVGEGYLKELAIDFRKVIRKYRHVYSMYDFSKVPKDSLGQKKHPLHHDIFQSRGGDDESEMEEPAFNVVKALEFL